MKIINNLIWFLIIPLLIIIAVLSNKYRLISLAIIILALIPFFLKFENRRPDAKEVVLLSVLTALVVIVRVVFSPLPFFKPVTALIILTGLVFGGEMGFLVGALSALLSNFYYGQGAWTPFQMFAWGLIGHFSSYFRRSIKLKGIRRSLVFAILGLSAGFVFGIIMDIQNVLFIDNHFNFRRFIASLIASFPFTIIHMLSNVFFLILFGEAIIKIFKRIKIKYY